MTSRSFTQCDGCGLVVENSVSSKGWIRITGSLSRAKGVYDHGSWQCDFAQNIDCCSMDCVLKILDGRVVKPLPLIFKQPTTMDDEKHDTAWDHLLDDNSSDTDAGPQAQYPDAPIAGP